MTDGQLTYTENGRTYGVVCAWCIDQLRGEVPAVELVATTRGGYPACRPCAEAVK